MVYRFEEALLKRHQEFERRESGSLGELAQSMEMLVKERMTFPCGNKTTFLKLSLPACCVSDTRATIAGFFWPILF